MEKLFETWYKPLVDAKCIELLDSIMSSLDVLYETTTVYPYKVNVFRVFREVPYEKLKVVLLGQDPYHSEHKQAYRDSFGNTSYGTLTPDACGLSFLTENGFIPPSLKNMFKALENDTVLRVNCNAKNPHTAENYNYHNWVSEGVLMLNTALTVEAGLPNSHSKIWKSWSLRLIHYLTTNRKDIVWILLGKEAQNLLKDYDVKKVEAVHPSPLAGNQFKNSKIYSRANELLENPIVW